MRRQHDPRGRRRGGLGCLFALPVVVMIGAIWLENKVRVAGEEWEVKKVELLVAARRAQPILDALDAYRADHDEWPKELTDLVPEHIESIPDPGLSFEGEWLYERGPAPTEDPGVYDLFVAVPADFCPTNVGLIHFNALFSFRSDGAYEEQDHGGGLERIGDWGYYHE